MSHPVPPKPPISKHFIPFVIPTSFPSTRVSRHGKSGAGRESDVLQEPQDRRSWSEAHLITSSAPGTFPLPDESVDTVGTTGRLEERETNAVEPEILPPTKRVQIPTKHFKGRGGRAISYRRILNNMKNAPEHTSPTALHPYKVESLNVPVLENKRSIKRHRGIGIQSRAPFSLCLSKTLHAPHQLDVLPSNCWFTYSVPTKVMDMQQGVYARSKSTSQINIAGIVVDS